jgi:CRISPR/Cas system Type II protein with McrA/HNH and RuvC-like nuclease domain
LFRNLKEASRRFNKRDNKSKGKTNKNMIVSFTVEDIINKFGYNTICYLSGEKINLDTDNFNFDHIIPTSRNGTNTFENLGITHPTVNYMKGDLTPEELIEWCEKILIHNGYGVTK